MKSPCKNGKKRNSDECRKSPCKTKITKDGLCSKKTGPKKSPKKGSPLKQNEFYCVKCRHRVTCDKSDISLKTKLNPRNNVNVHMLKCKCKHCDTTLNKFISAEMYNKLKK